jgi:branched-chain amino acid transport system ATP-binding protein
VYAERAAESRARAILHFLELLPHADTPAADLPVGIQRRVEIARALAMRPKLLLLDEPAAGLDAAETAHLAEVLQGVRERFQLSMLLVDHDMSLVMRACDYLYVLDFGKLLAKGRPAAIRDDPSVVAAYLGRPTEETATEEVVTVALAAAAPRALPVEKAPLLEVSGLAAGYGAMEVIRDVNLTVKRGEVVACVGANGAGKTTTLRALSGVVRSRRGRVVFDGEDITRSSPERIVRRGLVHIPQGRGLFPKLTIEETLRLASYSGQAVGTLDPAFEVFPRLAERRRQLVGTLSGGEQQMVAMARALLVQPRLLLIDEMSQGLAPTIVQQLFKTIEVFRNQGIAVFLVEQFVDSALGVADRAYVFEQGTAAHQATAAELRRDRTLIESSYLGGVKEAANGHNGHVKKGTELMEEFMLTLPADLLRALQERAAEQGRPASELARELLEAGER